MHPVLHGLYTPTSTPYTPYILHPSRKSERMRTGPPCILSLVSYHLMNHLPLLYFFTAKRAPIVCQDETRMLTIAYPSYTLTPRESGKHSYLYHLYIIPHETKSDVVVLPTPCYSSLLHLYPSLLQSYPPLTYACSPPLPPCSQRRFSMLVMWRASEHRANPIASSMGSTGTRTTDGSFLAIPDAAWKKLYTGSPFSRHRSILKNIMAQKQSNYRFTHSL